MKKLNKVQKNQKDNSMKSHTHTNTKKIVIFIIAKETINKTKRQSIEWEKTFTNYTSKKGLITKIYKELKELKSKKANNQI